LTRAAGGENRVSEDSITYNLKGEKKMVKSLGVFNEKGGTGKTTISVSVAAGLAIRGYRVVLVDSDPQANATLALGHKKEGGLYNLIIRDAEFQDVLRPVDPDIIGYDVQGELWVLPGNLETRGIPVMRPDPFILRKRVLGLDVDTDEEIGGGLEGWADYVIYDTAPTPSIIHTSIYMAADGMVFPTHCNYFSLDGLAESIIHKDGAQRQRTGNELGTIKTLGIIPTMYRKVEAHDVGLAQLTGKYKRAVWPCIPLRTIWEKASWAGETVFRFAPQHEVVTETWALVDRVVKGLAEVAHAS